MRKIPLRVISEKLPNGQIIPFSYRENIIASLRVGGERGMTAEEMEVRAPLIVKLEGYPDDAEYLLVEEAEFSVVAAAVSSLRFTTFFHSAIQWKNEIVNAATVEVEEKVK